MGSSQNNIVPKGHSVSGYNRDSSQQDLFTMTLLENNGNVSLRFHSGFFAYHLQNYLDDVRM